MKLYNLDTIVKRYLLDHGLPLHFYAQALSAGASALRELTLDTLKVINTVVLAPDQTYACELPCDFVDWTKVGVQVGQLIHPIAPLASINNLINTNQYGQPELYNSLSPGPNAVNANYVNGLSFAGWYWLWPNYSSLWENLGGMYGVDTGVTAQGFKIMPERNQIQLTESFGCANLYMEYISDGQSCNNASKIDSRAWSAITAYISWKRSKNMDNIKSPEGYNFVNERRILRSRLTDLNIESIRQSLSSAYRGSIKN